MGIHGAQSSWLRSLVSALVVCLLLPVGCAAIGEAQRADRVDLDLGKALRDGQPLLVKEVGELAAGGRQVFRFDLPGKESLDLRVPFADAPFNGTQLNVKINGKRLLPYFAFGGDTRYDNVKGKPGMRPPLATIEGRWLIPSSLLRAKKNELAVWTTGVTPDAALESVGPKLDIRIDEVSIGPAQGHALPAYSNSVYFDFDVWAQGYPWSAERRYVNDLALLGVINGKGMPCVIPTLGGPEQSLWAVKRACEDNTLGWGMTHQEFYTIWEFAAKTNLWAKFIDVDENPETQSRLTVIYNDQIPRGADVVLYDVEKLKNTLEPPIRFLAPYADFYNFRCEQSGPRGQGFGDDGERWAEHGLHGDLWATNYYEAMKAAHDLVRKYDPDDGRIQEMHFWGPPLRHLLYDTALQRKQPMSDMIDILMQHFTGDPTYDLGPDGKVIERDTYQLQYPGAQATGRRYPEIAIDFNRYRLSRTEEDMTLGDRQVNRWGNGEPFDYRAGFRGDEMIYNSENGVWRTGYSARAPYEFLHGFFCYSLLPTGASEPRDLKITSRKSLTELTSDPVGLYGDWVDGAGHTKRLRTVDPLYGDMFGWTGEEHCNFGDYITMVGIKDPHHRFPPYDAFGLVRRICYAFVTSGTVVPAYLNSGNSDELFVKCMAQTFAYKPYIGIYAANFDNVPHPLDVTLPIAFPKGTEAMVFDDRAWDWKASAQKLTLPGGRKFRYKAKVPALGAWLVLIPASRDVLASSLGLPAAPTSLSPVPDGAITEDRPTFGWQPGDAKGVRYVVEVAREGLFRPQDRVELSEPVETLTYTMQAAPEGQGRYFWRVRAIDERGRAGVWTAPRAFVYKWPEYSAVFPPQEAEEPAQEATAPAPTEVPEWQRLADEHHLETADNLAWQGEIFSEQGHMHAPSGAVDGQAFSTWTNDTDDEGHPTIPAEWCVIWPQAVKVKSVRILWVEGRVPPEFAVQVSKDAENWTDLFRTTEGADLLMTVDLAEPVEAKYFRIHITKAAVESGEVGVREVVIQ